jgi:hypothetical protein
MPYYVQPYYVQQPPYAGPVETETNDAGPIIDDLQNDVLRLTEVVDRLQQELTEARNPPVQMYVPEPGVTRQKLDPSEPGSAARSYTLVFRNGRRMEAQGYAIVGDVVWIVTPDDSIRVALSDLDLDATRESNLKDGLIFPGT